MRRKLLAAMLSALIMGSAGLCGCSDKTEDGGTDPPPEDRDEQPTYTAGNRFEYVNTKLSRFDYNGVKLSLDSPFKREFNYAMEYLLSVPTDDLLKVMRVRENKDVPGSNYLGGWYDGGLWVAATFGQYVSSLARGYALTGDDRLKNKATELIDGWADCISDDGFFYFSPDRLTNSTHYTYDKVVLMCVDVYTYIGGEVGERALEYLSTATDFAQDYLGTKRTPAGPNGPDSGQSQNGGNSDIEWYILSENLYRAYLASGDGKYKDFGDVWNYDYFWDALRNGEGGKYYNVHAYSHTNSISGNALKFMLTKNDKYLKNLTGAYEMYKDYELYPNGMYGTAERLVGTVRDLNTAIDSHANNCEVPCNTWAGMKMVKYLTELTGDARYYDWGEKLLYNGVLGTLPIKDDYVRRGISFYYANYQKNATKEYYGASWPCCSGTYFMNLCDVADQIYFKDEDSLYVANYIPSQAENNYNKRNVVVTQKQISSGLGADITVSCTSSANFELKLRIPDYAQSYTVELNGKTVDGTVEDGWFTVGSTFNNGDTVRLRFYTELRCEQIVEGDDYGNMIMYGSVYMVAKDAALSSITFAKGKTISDYIAGRDGETFYVRDENDMDFTFVPYYSLGEGDKYAGNLTVVVKGE